MGDLRELIERANSIHEKIAARTGAVKVELSGNTGELIDKMAEAIRGDTTSDDTPWAALSEDRKIGWRGDAERALAAIKDYLTPAPVVPAPEAQHTDDKAVDRFAAAMKRKLAQKREEGRGGWDDPEQCSAEYLSNLLRDHVEKGDPLDVGNLAMMLHQRGERISPAPEAQLAVLLAENERLRKVLSNLLAPFADDECRKDHHGYCQAHFLEEDCCVAAALRALTDARRFSS